MTEQQQKIVTKVAAEISLILADWMQDKFENGYTIDEVQAILDNMREMVK